MAFVAAMNSPPHPAGTKLGVKGANVYTEEGVGDLRVALFTQLVRGLDETSIINLVNKIVPLGPEYLKDLIIMAFQTRDVRGGKGERDLFYTFIRAVLKHKPEWSYDLLKLIPEYGCWKDLWELHLNFTQYIDRIVLEQFRLDQESERPSLLAKWLPREGSKYAYGAVHFARLFFPKPNSSTDKKVLAGQLRQYRKTVAYLNKVIDTTEVKMCANTWASINPQHVPGRLMLRNKLAFFNQKKERGEVVERHPESDDRKACAEHFKGLLKDVKEGKVVMKGAHVVMPHEIVHEIQYNWYNTESVEIHETRQAQWDAIRQKTLEAGGLGKIVPMCDFSGSMDGVPKEVSLALGILISEVSTNSFKDHILTFDSEPKWHSFSGITTLREKVQSIGRLGQGLSTNFQAACELILKRLVEHKVAPEDAPTDLLVLTDMGFDAANYGDSYHTKNSSWQTHFQMIRDAFQAHGYQAPRIVCWNLRAEYKDFHARAHEEGVVQLSGWSPAMLKAIQGEGIKVETPYSGMRRLLDDARYDAVRDVVVRLQRTEGESRVRDA